MFRLPRGDLNTMPKLRRTSVRPLGLDYSHLVVVVVNLASRLPQFLGSASSAHEGLGSQIGANLVRDEEVPDN